MASLTKKVIHGKPYYYLRETARVDGKPKVIRNEYLGTADDLADLLAGGGLPDKTKHLHFGDLGAVWSMLSRLDVIDIIDDVVGNKCVGDVSVGRYLGLVIANRVVAPCSKLAFADWWKTTAGDRICGIAGASVDHRRFWDAMNVLTEQHIVEIERRVFTHMVQAFDLDVSALSLDMTNFATFIDSANSRNSLSQRGHAKQKRNDLRLVGMGLVVTRDGAIPLASHVYGGNRPDVTQFSHMVTELTSRYGEIAAGSDVTVVYDAGQNSIANYETVKDLGLNFVSSVPPSDHPDLMGVDVSSYEKTGIEGLSVYDTSAILFKQNRRVVLSHSQNLHDKQRRGFEQTIDKARVKLNELADRLARGRTRRDKAAVDREIQSICTDTWLRRVVRYELTGDSPMSLRLTWSIDDKARTDLEYEVFGKRIIFTNRYDWNAEDVARAYRSQSDVESDFRQMKDPHVVGVSPIFHWTDQKIRVQLLCCVLALATANLMRRESRKVGLDLSVRELLRELGDIQQTVLFYATGGRPRVRNMLTDMSARQRKLFDLFDLEALAPKAR